MADFANDATRETAVENDKQPLLMQSPLTNSGGSEKKAKDVLSFDKALQRAGGLGKVNE